MKDLDFPKGNELALEYAVVANNYCNKDEFLAELTIKNTSKHTLKNNWTIYFNFIRKIYSESVSPEFKITHIDGDFFCLQPSDEYKGIKPDKETTIRFKAQYWSIKKIEKPSGFYIFFNDKKNGDSIPQKIENLVVKPFTRPEQLSRCETDLTPVPTPETRYNEAQALYLKDRKDLCPIIPSPSIFEKRNGAYFLPSTCIISYHKAFKSEAKYLKKSLKSIFGCKASISRKKNGHIRLIKVKSVSIKPGRKNAYQLSCNKKGIILSAMNSTGIFYSLSSLIQCLFHGIKDDKGILIQSVNVKDKPGLGYRGMHIDVARNFQSVDTIKRMITIMSLFKLNRLHLHLTDDEGWRIEIPDLKELTELGSKRGHTLDEDTCLYPSYGSGPHADDDLSPGNGYYTTAQYIDILKFAKKHHIEVIPEIDLPGHAKAALRAMENRYKKYSQQHQIEQAEEYLLTDWQDQSTYESVQMWCHNVVNVALPSTYHFIEKIVDTLRQMHKKARMPLHTLHIGGDEVPSGVWQNSPICDKLKLEQPKLQNTTDFYSYFINKVHAVLKRKKIALAGWEEIAMIHNANKKLPNNELLNKKVIPYCWNTGWGTGGESTPYMLANSGFDVILSNAPALYFDFAYDKDPHEDGFYWAGFTETKDIFRFLPYNLFKSVGPTAMGHTVDSQKAYQNAPKLKKKCYKNIKGMQGQLWGETLTSKERLEYMMLPRMIALAERAWNPNPKWYKEGDSDDQQRLAYYWNDFANRLSQLALPFLEKFLTTTYFRIPPPGFKVTDRKLFANTALPGFHIRYTTDGSMPTIHSTKYEAPLDLDFSELNMCTFSHSGRPSRVASWRK
jgi:hexosaminidase